MQHRRSKERNEAMNTHTHTKKKEVAAAQRCQTNKKKRIRTSTRRKCGSALLFICVRVMLSCPPRLWSSGAVSLSFSWFVSLVGRLGKPPFRPALPSTSSPFRFPPSLPLYAHAHVLSQHSEGAKLPRYRTRSLLLPPPRRQRKESKKLHERGSRVIAFPAQTPSQRRRTKPRAQVCAGFRVSFSFCFVDRCSSFWHLRAASRSFADAPTLTHLSSAYTCTRVDERASDSTGQDASATAGDESDAAHAPRIQGTGSRWGSAAHAAGSCTTATTRHAQWWPAADAAWHGEACTAATPRGSASSRWWRVIPSLSYATRPQRRWRSSAAVGRWPAGAAATARAQWCSTVECAALPDAAVRYQRRGADHLSLRRIWCSCASAAVLAPSAVPPTGSIRRRSGRHAPPGAVRRRL